MQEQAALLESANDQLSSMTALLQDVVKGLEDVVGGLQDVAKETNEVEQAVQQVDKSLGGLADEIGKEVGSAMNSFLNQLDDADGMIGGISRGLVGSAGGVKGLTRRLSGLMRNPYVVGGTVLAAAIAAPFAVSLGRELQRESQFAELRRATGLSQEQLGNIIPNLRVQGKLLKSQLEVLTEIYNTTGILPSFTAEQAEELRNVQKFLGLSAEETARFGALVFRTGGDVSDTVDSMGSILTRFNETADVAVGFAQAQKDIASLSEQTLFFYDNQLDVLTKQVAAARQLGVNFEQARNIAFGIMDMGIEGILAAQFKAGAFGVDADLLAPLAALGRGDEVGAAAAQQRALQQFQGGNLFAQRVGMGLAGAQELTAGLNNVAMAQNQGQAAVAATIQDTRSTLEVAKEQLALAGDRIIQGADNFARTSEKFIPAVDRFTNAVTNFGRRSSTAVGTN